MCAVSNIQRPQLLCPKLTCDQGRGVIHAEMPVQGPGIPEPRGLQLWVDLPKKVRSPRVYLALAFFA